MLTQTFYPATFRSGARSWNPLGELRHIHSEMDQLFSQALPRLTDHPPINVWSNEEETMVQAEMPGCDPDRIDISVQQKTLTLRGERQSAELKDGETLHRRERPAGRAVRTVELPYEVDTDKVEAEYKSGILSVRLPRAEANKPRTIAINAS